MHRKGVVLTELVIQPEAIYEVVAELGEAGVVHFKDLNKARSFQGHFRAEARRADEIESKILYIKEEVKKIGVSIPIPEAKASTPRARAQLNTDEINAMEKEIGNIERDVRKLRQTKESLKTIESLNSSAWQDLHLEIKRTKEHQEHVLKIGVTCISDLHKKASKMKAIYQEMNLFKMDMTSKCFIGECWVQTADLPIVQKALIDGSTTPAGLKMPFFLNKVETREEPPTVVRTNRFTGFQTLIDEYGQASNEIIFLSSFKWIISTVFGVTQIILGVCGAVNANYSVNFVKHRSSILLEFWLPLLFLVRSTVYMVQNKEKGWITNCKDDEKEEDPFMFRGQQLTQIIFILIAVCCIPVRLFGKTSYILRQRKLEKKNRKAQSKSGVNQKLNAAGGGKLMEEEEEQLIRYDRSEHWIEFVLATISWATYCLQIWTLYCAYPITFRDLWKCTVMVIEDKGPNQKYEITYAVWAAISLCVLVVMQIVINIWETLLLQCVEFMCMLISSKLARATYTFKPFSFAAINAMGIAGEDD